ncbi:hypothetical protein DFP73DRAFT_594032 [Morchella snyderi]|nr:hypothetical protein DFP73DRAFT_594032 [Morchella snyderi]
MGTDSQSEPWSLISRSNIVDYVHSVLVNLAELRNLSDVESELRGSSLVIAERYILSDQRRKNTQNLEEREALNLMCEYYRMQFKIWVHIVNEGIEKTQMCHKFHGGLVKGLLAMSGEDMKQLIKEFEAQEDVLIGHMETVETPLLPEGETFNNYIKLRSDLDDRLTNLRDRIEDLKDEIETGELRRKCELYEAMYGGTGDFVMIWILNRALVFILSSH